MHFIFLYLKYVFLNWLQLDGVFPWQLNQTISGIFVILEITLLNIILYIRGLLFSLATRKEMLSVALLWSLKTIISLEGCGLKALKLEKP